MSRRNNTKPIAKLEQLPDALVLVVDATNPMQRARVMVGLDKMQLPGVPQRVAVQLDRAATAGGYVVIGISSDPRTGIGAVVVPGPFIAARVATAIDIATREAVPPGDAPFASVHNLFFCAAAERDAIKTEVIRQTPRVGVMQ